MALSDTTCKSAKSPEKITKLSDGGGLYLQVQPNGSKLWRLAYRFGGSQKTLAIGSYPAITLKEARAKREEAKILLARGIDPYQQKKDDAAAKKLADTNTFSAIANEIIAEGERKGRADTTLHKKRWLLDMACEDFGNRPISEITAPEIMITLRKVEDSARYETARRLRAVIGQVFRRAVLDGRAASDPTAAMRGALETGTTKGRAALIDRAAFADLVKAVWTYNGQPVTCLALKLMVLLYPRPGELRLSTWAEFDLDKAAWTMPIAHTKMRREHRKPLPAMAVEILTQLRQLTGYSDYAFPAFHTKLKPMSENTLNQALRRLGFGKDEQTSHGFRSSASSLLNESGLWNPDAIEAELAHFSKDEIRNIYNRATYWDERVRMAEWWAGQIKSMIES